MDRMGTSVNHRPARVAIAAALAIASLSPAWASPSLLPSAIDGLLAAATAGDVDGLAREAAATTEPRLVAALASPDPRIRAAVTAAAPLAREPYLMLGALASLATKTDRLDAAPAASAAAQIARELDPLLLEEQEAPRDRLAAAAAAFRALSNESERWTDVRVHALETAVHLDRALGATGLVGDFFDDVDPELRRAAFELIADDEATTLTSRIVALVADEPELEVAAAAAGALCQLPTLPDLASADSRLVALLATKDLSFAQRIGVARCLMRRNSAADKQRLDQFAASLPTASRPGFTAERRAVAKRSKHP